MGLTQYYRCKSATIHIIRARYKRIIITTTYKFNHVQFWTKNFISFYFFFARVLSTLLCPKLTRDKFFQAHKHPLCPRASTVFIIVFYIHHVFLFLSVSLETGSQTASNKFSYGKFASLSGNFFAFTKRRRER